MRLVLEAGQRIKRVITENELERIQNEQFKFTTEEVSWNEIYKKDDKMASHHILSTE